MLVDALKALAEEHRLFMLASCSQHEVYTCQFVDVTGMSQSTVSSHIKALRSAGLLAQNKQKTWTGYYLNPDMDSDIAVVVRAVLARVYKDPLWQAFHERLLDSAVSGPCDD